jgi:hypothetical protein
MYALWRLQVGDFSRGVLLLSTLTSVAAPVLSDQSYFSRVFRYLKGDKRDVLTRLHYTSSALVKSVLVPLSRLNVMNLVESMDVLITLQVALADNVIGTCLLDFSDIGGVVETTDVAVLKCLINMFESVASLYRDTAAVPQLQHTAKNLIQKLTDIDADAVQSMYNQQQYSHSDNVSSHTSSSSSFGLSALHNAHSPHVHIRHTPNRLTSTPEQRSVFSANSLSQTHSPSSPPHA